MGHTICIVSQKGGVGKTTTAINLSAAFAVAERNALLVDCDPQGNATTGMGIDKTRLKKSLYHAMTGKVMVKELITESSLEFLKILPARIDLFRADEELRSKPYKEMISGRFCNLLGNYFPCLKHGQKYSANFDVGIESFL